MASQFVIQIDGRIRNVTTDVTFEQDDRLSPFADYVSWLQGDSAPIVEIEVGFFLMNGEVHAEP